jgi:uncharacterized protein (DUF488 family)
MVIYTVGHGARSTDELVSVLRSAGVGRLIDVRRHPGSRRHPHTAREAFARSLPRLGITYEWRGEQLGGRRRLQPNSRNVVWRIEAFRAYADYMETEPFQRALDELARDAALEPPLAILCAETLWWQCHRRLIADALTARGVRVVHLINESSHVEHVLNPAARIDERGLLVYDVGQTAHLPFGDG